MYREGNVGLSELEILQTDYNSVIHENIRFGLIVILLKFLVRDNKG